jgi:hypothetical protein
MSVDVYAGSLTGTFEGAVAFSLTGSGDWSLTPAGWYETTSYFDVTPEISLDNSTWTTANQSGDMTLVLAVPEPSTCLAGLLLLLPFGSSAFRQLRKKLQAAYP